MMLVTAKWQKRISLTQFARRTGLESQGKQLKEVSCLEITWNLWKHWPCSKIRRNPHNLAMCWTIWLDKWCCDTKLINWMSLHFVSQHKGKLIYIFLTIMSTYLHLQYPSKNEVSRTFYATSKEHQVYTCQGLWPPSPPKKNTTRTSCCKTSTCFQGTIFLLW